MTKHCAKCGKEFETRSKTHKFCTSTCAAPYNTILLTKSCRICQTEFTTMYRGKLYCGTECQTEANKPRNQFVTCQHCGKNTAKHPATRGGFRYGRVTEEAYEEDKKASGRGA